MRSRSILPSLAIAAAAACVPTVRADSVKPVAFGPYFKNQITLSASPLGYDYVLTNGFYHFQVGWFEPIAQSAGGLFGQTYFETNANLNLSPFTSDVGTTFNLKPLRYFEIGLSYNRLMFHNSMITFTRSGSGGLPPDAEYRPEALFSQHQELGGADIFSYQANATFDWGPAQFFFSGSRTLWDIDAKGKDFVYEYGDGMLLSVNDRVNFFTAQASLDLGMHSQFRSVSFVGFAIRDQYWTTDQTELEKNLVSFGITGFRIGRNSRFQRRGLDLSIGFWTRHDQIPSGNFAKSLMVLADWQWNIHVLKI